MPRGLHVLLFQQGARIQSTAWPHPAPVLQPPRGAPVANPRGEPKCLQTQQGFGSLRTPARCAASWCCGRAGATAWEPAEPRHPAPGAGGQRVRAPSTSRCPLITAPLLRPFGFVSILGLPDVEENDLFSSEGGFSRILASTFLIILQAPYPCVLPVLFFVNLNDTVD